MKFLKRLFGQEQLRRPMAAPATVGSGHSGTGNGGGRRADARVRAQHAHGANEPVVEVVPEPALEAARPVRERLAPRVLHPSKVSEVKSPTVERQAV